MNSGSKKLECRADILIVDDSTTDLRLLMDMMMARKLRISVAFDGQKGYRQAELLQPALILLDVHMPGIDGFATCRLLKENPLTRFIPVIFLTVATDLAERLQGFAVGGVDYISKPFHEEEVLARIGVHLDLPHQTPAEGGILPQDLPARTPQTFDAVIVAAAQKILRQAISHPPSLDGLARQVGSNRRRVNEAFQAYCGLPVFGWLREERLRQAHYLVGSTDTPISQIAEYLGFSTPTNFTKAFRERYDCPPRVLRQEIRTRRALGN